MVDYAFVIQPDPEMKTAIRETLWRAQGSLVFQPDHARTTADVSDRYQRRNETTVQWRRNRRCPTSHMGGCRSHKVGSIATSRQGDTNNTYASRTWIRATPYGFARGRGWDYDVGETSSGICGNSAGTFQTLRSLDILLNRVSTDYRPWYYEKVLAPYWLYMD